MRTIPSETYLSPPDSYIYGAAKLVGLNTFSSSLVRDIANIASGGEVLPPSAFREQVMEDAEAKVGGPISSGRFNYTYRTSEGYMSRGSASDNKAAVDEQFENDMRYHEKVCDFLKDIDLSETPGRTPLGKAVSILKILSTMNGGEPSHDESDNIPIIANEQDTVREVANKLNAKMEELQSLDDAEKHLLGIEEREEDVTENPDLSTADLQKVAGITNLSAGQAQRLEVARNLELLSQMNVRKRRHLEADVEGDDIKVRQIKGFDELGSLRQYEWALPESYRLMRVATRATSIRERAKRIDKKQLLYLIVDCSGSMDDPQRIGKACGIVMNRLKAVANEDAEVYLAFFAEKLYDEFSAKNAKEARALMMMVENHNFSGGGTAIANCAKLAAERINKMMEKDPMLTRPEIAIVTDGQDNVKSLTRDDFGKTVVHAFIVDSTNKDLVNFARSTGGSAIDNL